MPDDINPHGRWHPESFFDDESKANTEAAINNGSCLPGRVLILDDGSILTIRHMIKDMRTKKDSGTNEDH